MQLMQECGAPQPKDGIEYSNEELAEMSKTT